jgi:hypothetical protein
MNGISLDVTAYSYFSVRKSAITKRHTLEFVSERNESKMKRRSIRIIIIKRKKKKMVVAAPIIMIMATTTTTTAYICQCVQNTAALWWKTSD